MCCGLSPEEGGTNRPLLGSPVPPRTLPGDLQRARGAISCTVHSSHLPSLPAVNSNHLTFGQVPLMGEWLCRRHIKLQKESVHPIPLRCLAECVQSPRVLTMELPIEDLQNRILAAQLSGKENGFCVSCLTNSHQTQFSAASMGNGANREQPPCKAQGGSSRFSWDHR